MKDYQGNDARIFGLLGHNISYSLSPRIHNHYFTNHGIKAVYGLFDIEPDEFDSGVRSMASGLDGFNVTVPYKERIIPFVDNLSEEAVRTGSVNLVFNGTGYNSDYLALSRLMSTFRNELRGKECIILGAGGAARTASQLLGEAGSKLAIVNRNGERAEALRIELAAKGFQATSEKLSDVQDLAVLKSDCVINCISSGEIRFPAIESDYVVDFNYGSRSTAFRNSVKSCKRIITGEEILIGQAIYSQKIWNNGEPSFEELAEVLNVK